MDGERRISADVSHPLWHPVGLLRPRRATPSLTIASFVFIFLALHAAVFAFGFVNFAVKDNLQIARDARLARPT